MSYNETVLDHFANPRNAGRIKNPDAKGETGNPADGDRIIIYIRINGNRLQEVGFQTYGCPAAIAASSMLTLLATGKTVSEARHITNDDVARALGGLPPEKTTCSNIAADALHNALSNYEKERNTEKKEEQKKVKVQGKNNTEANNGTGIFEQPNHEDETNCQENMEATARQQASYLTPQQVQRYLRQIIMPEISGIGQETLLATHVMVNMPSVKWGDMMLCYLAAVGVGKITCVVSDIESGSEILEHVQDLNPEVQLKAVRRGNLQLSEDHQMPNTYIVIGPSDFVEAHWKGNGFENIVEAGMDNKIPGIHVAVRPWQGTLHTHGYSPGYSQDDSQAVQKKAAVLSGMTMPGDETLKRASLGEELTLGERLSASFGGTMAVIDVVKIRLNIGQKTIKPFVYDLATMTFGEDMNPDLVDSPILTLQKGSEHLDDKQLGQCLAKSKVLLIGSGGLGSPSAFALAKAGIGTIGLVDHDQVDLSNLNRQILHTTSRIGISKVESGAKTLQMVYPKITVNTYKERMTEANIDRLLKEYDLLLDGLDNLPSRYVANRAAVAVGKPFIQAGVLTFYGQSTSILPGEGPCYECIFPPSEDNGNAPTCEETGVLGAVPGLMGVIQAVEVIKQLCDIKPSLLNKYLMVDVLESEFTTIEFSRRPGCSTCSTT